MQVFGSKAVLLDLEIFITGLTKIGLSLTFNLQKCDIISQKKHAKKFLFFIFMSDDTKFIYDTMKFVTYIS